ncbi:MAG: large subunit ribosomal protein L10 [Chlamydiales bacterium]|jgi:large subunit ribosomal protein L10
MPNLVNQMVTRQLSEDLGEVQNMVLVSFEGLTVQETERIRSDLATNGVKLRMVRNNLARRVLAERGIEFEKGTLVGNTALAYGEAEGAIHAAKVFTGPEVKKAGKVKVKAGMLDGAVLNASDAAALADIPDPDTMRAMVLGVISAPARSLVGVLNGLPSGLARVVQARADQLED